MKRLIEITVSPDGQTKIQTRGFTGRSCKEASRFLEATIGRWQSERLTSEFHQQSTEIENQTETEETQ